MRNIPLKDFPGVNSARGSSPVTAHEVLSELVRLHQTYSSRRSSLTEVWYDCYLKYLASNPLASRESLHAAQRITGISGHNWRARYVGSKAFDQVETIVSYFMGAMFPGSKFFGLRPLEPLEDPEWETILELVRCRLHESLNRNKFSTTVEVFMRELVITGLSAVCTPWMLGDTSLSAWSPFDVYLDPDSHDPNESNVIRTYKHTRGEYLSLLKDGVYPYGDKDVGGGYEPFAETNYKDALSVLQGVEPHDLGRGNSVVNVREFWGDLTLTDGTTLYNIVAQYTDTQLLNVYPNDYGDVRPFVFCRYIPLTKTPYGLGAIQPVLGQLSATDVLLNRRADSVILQTDQAYTYIEGGIVDPDLIEITPGAMIPVTAPNAIQPLPMQSTNLQVSVTDQIMLEQAIDKATGTGPYVGINAGRTQERVTATEVSAQKEAGGVRLSTRYTHIDTEFLVPFLSLYLSLHQNYSSQVYYIRLGLLTGPGKYYPVPPEMLQLPVKVYTIGSGHLTNKEVTVRQLLQWMQVAGSNQELAQRVDWGRTMEVFTHLMVPDYADQLLAPAPTQEALPQMGQQPGAMQGPDMNLRQEQALGAAEQAGMIPQLAQEVGASLGLNPAAPDLTNLA
jgi:hypothetical protein